LDELSTGSPLPTGAYRPASVRPSHTLSCSEVEQLEKRRVWIYSHYWPAWFKSVKGRTRGLSVIGDVNKLVWEESFLAVEKCLDEEEENLSPLNYRFLWWLVNVCIMESKVRTCLKCFWLKSVCIYFFALRSHWAWTGKVFPNRRR